MRSSGYYPRNSRVAWTAEDDAKLVELCKAGERPALIAKAVGRSQAACKQRWYQLREPRAVKAAPATSEKRTTPRRGVLKAGKIEIGRSAIDCTVRYQSATGAGLDVKGYVGIPEHFTLFIPSDGLRFACMVVHRRGEKLGVTFI